MQKMRANHEAQGFETPTCKNPELIEIWLPGPVRTRVANMGWSRCGVQRGGLQWNLATQIQIS